jgi:hypothetical protein
MQRDTSLCSRILAIGRATPAYRVSQEESFRLSRYERDAARRVFLNSGIDFRHFYFEQEPRLDGDPGRGSRHARGHLNMLVMNGGRERTEEEFRQLFDAADLHVTRLIPTLAPQWVIEGTRRRAPRRCR